MTHPDEAPKSGGLTRAVQAGLTGEAVTARGVLAAIGGARGVIESLLPPTIYLVVYVLTRDARISAIAPLALAAIAILVRVIRREPLAAALSGLVGVIVCVAAVMFTGEGASYFVPGFYINGAWIAAHTISLIVGWPLIGFVLGFFRGSLTGWRKEPLLRRAAQIVTVFWILVFVARLAVQLPFYFAGNTEALGIARLVMGVPLFAVAIVFTWLVLARVSALVDGAKRQADLKAQDNTAGGEGSGYSSDE